MKKLLKPLLIAMFAIQLGVPAYMIYEQTQILSEGTVYKFKTQPIDPYDPFRGRYVTLNYQADNAYIPSEDLLVKGDWAYALITVNDEGFAEFSHIVSEQPEAGEDYLYAQIGWGTQERGYRIKFPFTRYYASEKVAPEIERAVWSRQRTREDDVYAEISIHNGKGSISGLFVNDMPVRKFIEKAAETSDNGNR